MLTMLLSTRSGRYGGCENGYYVAGVAPISEALWHNAGMKGLMIITAVLLGITAVLFAALVLFAPQWDRSSPTDDGMVLSSIPSQEELPDEVSYVQKFDYALGKLDGIAEPSQYLVVVDISEQKEYVYSKDGELLYLYKVSTGAAAVRVADSPDDPDTDPEYQDRSMGESVWKVVSKRDSGLAALYGPRLMMMDRYVSGRWIETDVALHGTDEPENLGRPVSLGCVYHDNADIIQLYDLLPVGTLVVAIR